MKKDVKLYFEFLTHTCLPPSLPGEREKVFPVRVRNFFSINSGKNLRM